MITEVVLFDLPQGMSRAEAVEVFRKGAPNWQANPELIRKNFLYDPERQRGGGVYLWPNIEAAKRAHGDAFHQLIRERFGSVPSFQYFETPVVVDNVLGKIIEAPLQSV